MDITNKENIIYVLTYSHFGCTKLLCSFFCSETLQKRWIIILILAPELQKFNDTYQGITFDRVTQFKYVQKVWILII